MNDEGFGQKLFRDILFSRSVFALSFTPKSPNFNITKVWQSENAPCLAAKCPLPRQWGSVDISAKAWEWTVYFVIGRLAMPGVR